MVDLSIITVTYNNEGSIKAYLESLKKQISNAEIIIIDNNSSDKTLELVSQEKGITLIKNRGNLGFGKANNLAFKKSTGEYILFLNPDAALQKGFDEAFNYIKEHQGIGILAPKLMEGNTPQKSIRKLPTIKGALQEYFLHKKNQYEPYAAESSEPIEVESVVGACMLISRGVFEKLGGFDEKFFMYFEDLDLCRKIKREGYKVVYFPGWVVNHRVGFSKDERKSAWLLESAKKYHGSLYFFVLNLLLRMRPRV